MTELSLQAQTVLDAANGAQSYGPDDCLNESRWIAAAALQAVVDRIAKGVPPGQSVWGEGYVEGVIFFRDEILAIAAELRGQN